MIDKVKAKKALALGRKGLRGKAASLKLGVTTDEANTLARVGLALENIESSAFTDREMLLLWSLARCHRRNLDEGITRSPTSPEVAWAARKSESWPAAASRRLRSGYLDAECTKLGFGLVHLAGNGAIWLTTLGWMVVQAVEVAEARASKTPLLALSGLLAVRPESWDDGDDVEQAAAWRFAEMIVAERTR